MKIQYVIRINNKDWKTYNDITIAKKEAEELKKAGKKIDCFTELDLQNTVYDYKR